MQTSTERVWGGLIRVTAALQGGSTQSSVAVGDQGLQGFQEIGDIIHEAVYSLGCRIVLFEIVAL